jgi:hypothetical protein
MTDSTPNPKRPSLVSVTPSKLSPSSTSTKDPPLRLPDGCKLVVDFQGSVRTPPRLLLKEHNKQQMVWPLEELSSISINTSGLDTEPFLRFTLVSDLDPQGPHSSENDALQAAFRLGALQRGTKTMYLKAAEARALYDEFRQHKEAGSSCMKHLELHRVGDGDEMASMVGLDSLSLGGPSTASDGGVSPPLPAAGRSASSLSLGSATTVGGQPPTNLIFVCSPDGADLKHAQDEALEINNELYSRVRCGGTAEQLQEDLLKGHGCYRSFLFTGHGVLPATAAAAAPSSTPAEPPETRMRTLGFTDKGSRRLCVIEAPKLAEMLGHHGLQLVFLNGCDTEALGRALRGAGVPHVVCWRTPALDCAARVFARRFYEAYAISGVCREAFDHARHAVKMRTCQAYSCDLLTKLKDEVAKYELRDPAEPPPKPPLGYMASGHPLPLAAGIPVFLSCDGDVVGE